MKSLLKLLSIFALIIFFNTNTFAQNAPAKETSSATMSNVPVEVKIPVTGVCNDCKKRIETAASIKGVKLVDWDKSTQILSVIYKPGKVSEQAIHEAVAAAGHDTAMVRADDKIYSKLPGCCQYRDGIEVH